MISGKNSDESQKLLGDGTLGYQWESLVDNMAVRLKVNLSKSKKKIHRFPNFTMDDLDRLKTVKLTKRKLLMMTGSVYDPLSILSPFTVKLKISMGELTAVHPNLPWDSTIPDHFNLKWINYMEEIIRCPKVHFSRRILPHGYRGKPNLAGYFDGSIFVFSAVVYVWVAWWNADQQLWDFWVCLLTSKTRICPQFGLTAYKSELSGCTLLHRLLNNIVKFSPLPIETVVTAGDSKAAIATLDTQPIKLKPFAQNRVNEIQMIRKELKDKSILEPVYYIPGDTNPADKATRKDMKLDDLGMYSEWQTPSFMKQPRGDWPLSLDIPNQPPTDQLRTRYQEISEIPDKFRLNVQNVNISCDLLSWSKKMLEISNYSNSYVKVVRCTVRLLRLSSALGESPTLLNIFTPPMLQSKSLSESYTRWSITEKKSIAENSLESSVKKSCSNEQVCLSEDNIQVSESTKTETKMFKQFFTPISDSEFQTAEKLLLLWAMTYTWSDHKKKKLDSLVPKLDKSGVILYTSGRLGEQPMLRILGKDKIPIIPRRCRLAYLFMFKSHVEDCSRDAHRGVQSTLVRSRLYCWIPEGKKLARHIVNSCFGCKRRLASLTEQRMSLLPEITSTPTPCFTYTSLDFCGPFWVVDEVKRRVKLKVWLLIYVCQSTKAAEVLVTSGYDTDNFLIRHQEFVFRRGRPLVIRCDGGTQLQKSKRITGADDSNQAGLNWKIIRRKNEKTHWDIIESHSPWRNGLAEVTVREAKIALIAQMRGNRDVRFGEMVTLTSGVAFLLNSRPIALKSSSDLSEEPQPITPLMLLTGRCDLDTPTPTAFLESASLTVRTGYVQDLLQAWWSKWESQVFNTLFHMRKWKKKIKNLKVGDICQLLTSNLLAGTYRLVKITKIYQEEDGVVRSVDITYRRPDKRESVEKYVPRQVENKVSVQRLLYLFNENDPACPHNEDIDRVNELYHRITKSSTSTS